MQGLGDHVISSGVPRGAGSVEMSAATGRRARLAGALRAGIGSRIAGPTASGSRRPSIKWSGRDDGRLPCSRCRCTCPPKAASEIEATIIEWHVAEGDRFRKGEALVQVDSAKSVFDFEAPCDGLVMRRSAPGGRDPAADRAHHGDRDRRSGDARLDSAGRGRRTARRAGRSRAGPASAARRRADRVARVSAATCPTAW